MRPRYGQFNPRPEPKPRLPARPQGYQNNQIADALKHLDLGSGIAEQDTLLDVARVETSAFSDLLDDRVDLVPGTKGSGKSALYRVFVEFIPQHLLRNRRIVIAHGATQAGDQLFNRFHEHFKDFDERDFLSFWCIYLVSLANSQFVEKVEFARFLASHKEKVSDFHEALKKCGVSVTKAKNALQELLDHSLQLVKSFRPSKMKYELPHEGGAVEFELGESGGVTVETLPTYIREVKDNLETLLKSCDLRLWLMVDRLDEIFERRSATERLAMRGLLRTLRVFESPHIRVKLFIRDDMLDAVVSGGDGFTALSHVTSRKADVLRWSEEQILTMIVKRAFASVEFRAFVGVDKTRLAEDMAYRQAAFYRIFPPTADRGTRRSSTIKWIYSHLADGNNVVTPRDVIDLLTIAKQRQQDLCQEAPGELSEHIIGSKALKYALTELSKKKRSTYLEAEFPHLWAKIKKLVDGKTELAEPSLKKLYGERWPTVVDDLVSVGVLRAERKKDRSKAWKVPFVYRAGLEVRQGRSV